MRPSWALGAFGAALLAAAAVAAQPTGGSAAQNAPGAALPAPPASSVPPAPTPATAAPQPTESPEPSAGASAIAPAAPAPAPVTSAPPAAAAPAATAAAATPAGLPLAPAMLHLDSAVVHLWASYPGAVLELRSSVDEGPWRAACQAPCDRRLRVEGTEARVVAPGMTTSNSFRIEPGHGVASFKVNGGSASARQFGTIALIAGIPVSLGGMGLYGWGRLKDESGLKVAGIATLAVGGVLVVGSLPFLSMGSTRIRDARGREIARAFSPPPM